MNTRPDSTLAGLAFQAHDARERERTAEREFARRKSESVRLASQRSPEDLGLELCSDCGWYRDPVPDAARESVSAFRDYLAATRARCMCTTDRCGRCDEPWSDVPTPWYYCTERRHLVRSGSFAVSMGHRARCRARDDG